jgi:hypothetical protein
VELRRPCRILAVLERSLYSPLAAVGVELKRPCRILVVLERSLYFPCKAVETLAPFSAIHLYGSGF